MNELAVRKRIRGLGGGVSPPLRERRLGTSWRVWRVRRGGEGPEGPGVSGGSYTFTSVNSQWHFCNSAFHMVTCSGVVGVSPPQDVARKKAHVNVICLRVHGKCRDMT